MLHNIAQILKQSLQKVKYQFALADILLSMTFFLVRKILVDEK